MTDPPIVRVVRWLLAVPWLALVIAFYTLGIPDFPDMPWWEGDATQLLYIAAVPVFMGIAYLLAWMLLLQVFNLLWIAVWFLVLLRRRPLGDLPSERAMDFLTGEIYTRPPQQPS